MTRADRERARRRRVDHVRAERGLELAERVDVALTLLRVALLNKVATQLELAARVGVHNASISLWAAGRWRPTAEKLPLLERALTDLGIKGAGRKLRAPRADERKRIHAALRTAVACGGSDEVVAGLARLLVGQPAARRNKRRTA